MMQSRLPIRSVRDRRGGALVVVTFTIAVLSLVAANVLNSVSLKYAAVYQAASWQESLTGAEAGIAYGLTALRRPLLERQSAWNGWLDESTVTEFKKSYPPEGYVTLAHSGDGNQAVRFRVTISAQTGAGTLNPNASRPNDPRNYYKIRAVGAAGLPGSRRLSPYKSDIALRKLNWLWDGRTGRATSQPEAVRVIEAVAKPVTPFSIAIMAQEHLEIVKGSGQVIDSYNSDKGDYDPAKRRSFGNIATNGKANNMVKLENVTVHGDVAKQGGLVQMLANAKVTGRVINDFHRELKPVLSPREDANFRPLTAWPVDAERKNITLHGSADPDNPVRYKLNTIHLHAREKLIIKRHDPDQRSYVHIWVPGDVTIHKGGSIEIEEGVNVSFFVERNVTLEENQNTGGIRNLNAKPETLTIYGVLADDQVGAFNLKSGFKGTIFAPKHDFFVNLKAGRHIYGSLVGRRFRIEGRTQVHYDESLEDKGLTMDYALASWMEDWFDPAVRKN